MAVFTVKGWVSGKVQGVWFRRFVQQVAQARQVTGYARNLPDGRVEVLLCGDKNAVSAVQKQVAIGPPASQVKEVVWEPAAQYLRSGFEVC